MKRKYIAPLSDALNIVWEGFLCDSIEIGSGTTSGGFHAPDKEGWSSENWDTPTEDFADGTAE